MNLGELEKAVGETADAEKPLGPPVPRKLSDLVLPTENDPDELLKYRFLSRGGGMLLVGPTGAGKSALAMQAKILWALGREAFGFKPARPLKSLLVQAENDDGDLAEMRDGVMRGLYLSEEDRKKVGEMVLVGDLPVRIGIVLHVHGAGFLREAQ